MLDVYESGNVLLCLIGQWHERFHQVLLYHIFMSLVNPQITFLGHYQCHIGVVVGILQ